MDSVIRGSSSVHRLEILALLIVLILQAVPTDDAVGLPLLTRLAIPIDSSSASVWSEAMSGAPAVGIIILNPANGPGNGSDPGVAQLVARAQGKGISVLGYVYTEWADGNVSLQQAEGWIDHYYAWYHVDGIMLDEANDTCGPAAFGFYQALYAYVKSKPSPATVMLNPGKATGECYAGVSDVLLTFEDSYGVYLSDYHQNSWTTSFPPGHFFHIVLGVSTAVEMESVVITAIDRGAGWVFVTDLNVSSGNPYGSLPPYFDREVAYLSDGNSAVGTSSSMLPAIVILGATASASALVVIRSRKKVPR